MRILRAIIVENDTAAIHKYKQFEKENGVLFSIVSIVPDLLTITDLVNLEKPDVLVVNCDCVTIDSTFLTNLSVHKPKLLLVSNYELALTKHTDKMQLILYYNQLTPIR